MTIERCPVGRIRKVYHNLPQRTLARALSVAADPTAPFPFVPLRMLGVETDQCFEDLLRLHRLSYAAIYNRIRRCDGSIR